MNKIMKDISTFFNDKSNEKKKNIVLKNKIEDDEIFSIFINWISNNKTKSQNLIKVIRDKKFISIKSKDENDAYKLFYRINNIALKLNHWDNIKSHFYINDINDNLFEIKNLINKKH